MTKNEAIKEVRFNMSTIGLNDKAVKRVTEARDMAVQALEEVEVLKEKNKTLKALYEDARKEGSNLLARARENAIDEFAERLKERIVGMQMAELQGEDICPCAENGKECPYINQDIGCQYCAREHTIKDIDEIAEEMKGSEENEVY